MGYAIEDAVGIAWDVPDWLPFGLYISDVRKELGRKPGEGTLRDWGLAFERIHRGHLMPEGSKNRVGALWYTEADGGHISRECSTKWG